MRSSMRLLVCVLLSTCLFTTFSLPALAGEAEDRYRPIGAVPGYNPRVQYYEVPEGFPKYDDTVIFIGNIRGDWREMGYQYGERAGSLILNVYNYLIGHFKAKFGLPHLREDLERYSKVIRDYSPQMIEFMKGIGEGASEVLGESTHSKDLTDFEKILLINVYLDLDFGHPKPEFHKGKTTPIPGQRTGQSVHKKFAAQHCTGFAASGNARGPLLSPTKNRETLIANNYDLPKFVPGGWSVAYVATPKDPKAHCFWSMQPAGVVGGYNLIVNDRGVGIGNFFGGRSTDEIDFGLAIAPLMVHAAAYCGSARETIDMMTLGSPDYRKKSNRKTILQTGPWAYLIADPDEVAVLEVSSHRHAVRTPGDMNEAGNYVVYANWYGSKKYYDENNQLVSEPMGIQPPEFPERYHTFDWYIKHHFGEIDADTAKEMQGIRYFYEEKTGKKIEFLEDSNIPVYIGKHTPCAYWGAAIDVDMGGTVHAAQAILRKDGKTKIYWVQGRPCEWVGPWQSVDFSGYRK